MLINIIFINLHVLLSLRLSKVELHGNEYSAENLVEVLVSEPVLHFFKMERKAFDSIHDATFLKEVILINEGGFFFCVK